MIFRHFQDLDCTKCENLSMPWPNKAKTASNSIKSRWQFSATKKNFFGNENFLQFMIRNCMQLQGYFSQRSGFENNETTVTIDDVLSPDIDIMLSHS